VLLYYLKLMVIIFDVVNRDKQNKGAILKASVDYIKNLQNEINRTKDLEEKLSKMTILNKMLIDRIQVNK
jgi:hypothetical protein